MWANTDVLLEVSAPGFKTWTPGFPLRLQVGAEMHLDVPLEPSYDPNARPSKFLVPDGYVGWVQLEYDVREAQTSTVESDVTVFKFPEDGVLITSSPGPQRNGRNEFMFYFNDGSERELPMDYRGGRALIWGQYDGSKGGRITLFGFFVGSEDQYKKYQSRANRPGRITNP